MFTTTPPPLKHLLFNSSALFLYSVFLSGVFLPISLNMINLILNNHLLLCYLLLPLLLLLSEEYIGIYLTISSLFNSTVSLFTETARWKSLYINLHLDVRLLP